jgi:hypothetical protein
MNKGGYFVFIRDNLLFFLISFSSVHPNLRLSHEDMRRNIILEATDKTFLEKNHQTCPLYEKPVSQKKL